MILRLTISCNHNDYMIFASESVMFGTKSLPAFISALGFTSFIHSHELSLDNMRVSLKSYPVSPVITIAEMEHLCGKKIPDGSLFLQIYNLWATRPSFVLSEHKIACCLEQLKDMAGICDKCDKESCECYAIA